MANRRRFVGVRKSSSGQAPILAGIFFLLLVPTTIILAENATINLTGQITANIFPENTSLNITDIIPLENKTVNGTPLLENTTLPTNMTFPEENVTLPEENTTLPDNQTNATIPEETITAPENETHILPEEPLGAVLHVNLDVPEAANRNDHFPVSAEITNTGDEEAHDVEIEWVLPDGLQIIDGSSSHYCDIPAHAACESHLTVAAPLSFKLGDSEIKILVRYHD